MIRVNLVTKASILDVKESHGTQEIVGKTCRNVSVQMKKRTKNGMDTRICEWSNFSAPRKQRSQKCVFNFLDTLKTRKSSSTSTVSWCTSSRSIVDRKPRRTRIKTTDALESDVLIRRDRDLMDLDAGELTLYTVSMSNFSLHIALARSCAEQHVSRHRAAQMLWLSQCYP